MGSPLSRCGVLQITDQIVVELVVVPAFVLMPVTDPVLRCCSPDYESCCDGRSWSNRRLPEPHARHRAGARAGQAITSYYLVGVYVPAPVVPS